MPRYPIVLNKPEEMTEEPFWTKIRREVFDLYVEGKTVGQIAKHLFQSKDFVLDIITQPQFIRRYEVYIKDTFLRKHRIAHEAIELLWKKVKENIKDIPPKTALMELKNLLIGVLKEGKSGPRSIGDMKQTNVYLGESKDMKKLFGFQQLEDKPKKKPKKK